MIQGYKFWPNFLVQIEKKGRIWRRTWKKEGKRGERRKKEKSDKTNVKIPLWSLNNCKKSTKTGKNFSGWPEYIPLFDVAWGHFDTVWHKNGVFDQISRCSGHFDVASRRRKIILELWLTPTPGLSSDTDLKVRCCVFFIWIKTGVSWLKRVCPKYIQVEFKIQRCLLNGGPHNHSWNKYHPWC